MLSEKPMALSTAECERIIAASRRANRKLMVTYRSHFEPYNMEAMKLTAFGRVRLVRTEQSYRMQPTSPSAN